MRKGFSTSHHGVLAVIVRVAFFSMMVCAPAYAADPFAFLPAKEAQVARDTLFSLDTSLSTWTVAWNGFWGSARKSRSAVRSAKDADAYKKLLESGVNGTWRSGKGPTLFAAETSVRKSAGALASILEPRIAKLPGSSVDGLLALFLERERRIPGAAPEHIDFLERLAKSDLPLRRFALRALLPLIPDEVASRLCPDGKETASLPYGADATMQGRGTELARFGRAMLAVRAAAPALSVPELLWTQQESRMVEVAAKLLSTLSPALRRHILESGAAFPGVELLPAFLSALSPENRALWAMGRALSPSTVQIFLSTSYENAASGVDAFAAGISLARSVSEIERDRARGLSGLDFLTRTMDPALRYAIQQDTSLAGLRAARDDARATLAAALEIRLKELAVSTGSGISPAKDRQFKVEFRDNSGLAGFALVRAYAEASDGTRDSVSSKILERVLERELPGLASTAGIAPKAVRFGFFVSEGAQKSDMEFPSCKVAGTDTATFAAILALRSNLLRSAAEHAGVSYAYICPKELSELASLCVLRCRGRARDEDVVTAMERVGDPAQVDALLDAAYTRLDIVKRALIVFSQEGTSR
jgi:hypothetical protein